MIQTWKEVSLYQVKVSRIDGSLTLDNREDMVVGGRSGQNKLFATSKMAGRKSGCTTYHQHHIMGAHSKEDGVLITRGLSLYESMYSTAAYKNANKQVKPVVAVAMGLYVT